MDRAIKIIGIAVMIVLLTTAAAAGDHGEAAHHGFDWMGFLGKLVNATILFGGLIFLLRKPVIEFLTHKSLGIKTDILQREENVKTTTSQLEEIGKRLEKIELEVTRMKEAAQENGIEEQKRIEELGKKEAQRILDLTDAEISNRVENSVRNLKARIADLTIEHFKADVEKQLDKKAHENIIEKNIEISGDIIERE